MKLSQDITTRRLRWFGHALRRLPGELVHDVIDPQPMPQWKKRRGGQLCTWLSSIKMEMEESTGPKIYGLRRWNNEWVKISKELANNRQAWSAFIRDHIEAMEGAGSTHPG